MNISKIFGFVLCLHVGVIAILIVQPGCRTTQPPTQVYTQDRTTDMVDMAPPVTGDGSLDAAFNAGFESESTGRSAPMRPAGDFSEFSGVEPLEPLNAGSTVDVAGPSYETYTVKKGDSLWGIAKNYNVSVNELYQANGLNKNSVIKIGQQIQIPVEGASMSVTAPSADSYQPTSLNMSTETYTVRSGDSLSKIARQYGTTVQAIKATNNKTSDVIRIGEKLTIPVSGASSTSTTTVTNKPAPSISVTSTSGSRTHVVQAGEYPATIARKYGMTTSELLAMNGITDPRKLQVGQKLKVSASGSAANIDTKTETVSGTPAPQPSNQRPVQIRVIEADPLVESDVAQISEAPEVTPAPAEEIDPDSLFENAVEIPVIRMEEGQ